MHLRLPEALARKLDQRTAETGATGPEVVRRALSEYLGVPNGAPDTPEKTSRELPDYEAIAEKAEEKLEQRIKQLQAQGMTRLLADRTARKELAHA